MAGPSSATTSASASGANAPSSSAISSPTPFFMSLNKNQFIAMALIMATLMLVIVFPWGPSEDTHAGNVHRLHAMNSFKDHERVLYWCTEDGVRMVWRNNIVDRANVQDCPQNVNRALEQQGRITGSEMANKIDEKMVKFESGEKLLESEIKQLGIKGVNLGSSSSSSGGDGDGDGGGSKGSSSSGGSGSGSGSSSESVQQQAQDLNNELNKGIAYEKEMQGEINQIKQDDKDLDQLKSEKKTLQNQLNADQNSLSSQPEQVIVMPAGSPINQQRNEH